MFILSKKFLLGAVLLTGSTLVSANTDLKQQIISALKENPDLLKQAIEQNPEILNQALSTETFTKLLAENKTISGLKVEQSALIAQSEKNLQKKMDDTFNNFAGGNNNSFVVNTATTGVSMLLNSNPITKKYVSDTKDHFDRHVYFTTTAGYQWSPSSAKKQQEQTYDFSKKDDMITNFALGLYLSGSTAQKLKDAKDELTTAEKNLSDAKKSGNTQLVELEKKYTSAKRDLADLNKKRGFAIQGEYGELRTKTSEGDQLAQKNMAVLGLIPILPQDVSYDLYDKFDMHLYGIAGAGYSTLKGSADSGSYEDALGIVGVGYSKGIKDSQMQIIGEARAVYSMKENYWQPQVMAGIRVGVGQYMSKYLP